MLALRKVFVLSLLPVLLGVVSLWSLSTGDVDIRWQDMPAILSDKDKMEYAVLAYLRIPRLLLAFAVGASLSLSGVILQGIYRNPLVEPFTLGISGGASLGVALCIILGLASTVGAWMLPVFGFSGALLSIFAVYVLGSRVQREGFSKMLLTGVMVSLVCSSILMFLLSVSTTEDLQSIIFWTMGSLQHSDTTLVALVLVCSLLVCATAHFFAHSLNAMRLGATEAQHLGVHVSRTVKILFVITSLLTGVCVAVAGIIGFVGLVIPHFMRKLVGTDYRFLLLSSFLAGGIFLIVCDVLSRWLIAPNELPVGVLTGLIGGVLFIVVLSRKDGGWTR